MAAFAPKGQSRRSPGPRPSARWAGGRPPMSSGPGFGELWLQPSGSVGLMGAQAAGQLRAGRPRPCPCRAAVRPALRVQERRRHLHALRVQRGAPGSDRTPRRIRLRTDRERRLAGRNLAEDTVRELVDRAPLAASEAKEAGLVDHLGYRDEVRAARRPALSRQADVCSSSRATTGASTACAAPARHASPPWASSRPWARSAPAGRNRAR